MNTDLIILSKSNVYFINILLVEEGGISGYLENETLHNYTRSGRREVSNQITKNSIIEAVSKNIDIENLKVRSILFTFDNIIINDFKQENNSKLFPFSLGLDYIKRNEENSYSDISDQELEYQINLINKM